MRIRYTYVCEDCHAGWQFDSNLDPMARSDLATRCRWCGQEGKLRGMYSATILPHSSHAQPSLPREGQEGTDTGPPSVG